MNTRQQVIKNTLLGMYQSIQTGKLHLTPEELNSAAVLLSEYQTSINALGKRDFVLSLLDKLASQNCYVGEFQQHAFKLVIDYEIDSTSVRINLHEVFYDHIDSMVPVGS